MASESEAWNLEPLLDDVVNLLVWACRSELLYGDETESVTGPAWLAERLYHPTTRALAFDILKLAGTEARRLVEADPELDDQFAYALGLLARFEQRAAAHVARAPHVTTARGVRSVAADRERAAGRRSHGAAGHRRKEQSQDQLSRRSTINA